MAELTILQIINIAKVSQELATVNNAKGNLFGPRLSPTSPIVLYNERKAVEWLYNLDPTNSTLRLTANYLYSLCRGYNLKALAIIDGSGGQVNPPVPVEQFVWYPFVAIFGSESIDISGTPNFTRGFMVKGKQLVSITVNGNPTLYVDIDFTFDSPSGTITLINSNNFFTGDIISGGLYRFIGR